MPVSCNVTCRNVRAARRGLLDGVHFFLQPNLSCFTPCNSTSESNPGDMAMDQQHKATKTVLGCRMFLSA
jgi:hypothetical protein